MPTYAYRCPSCGNEFEEFHKISDPPASCPRCGTVAERLITGGGGFLLKGAGFYMTDYRSDRYKQAAKAESSAGGAGETSPAKEGGGSSTGAEAAGSARGSGTSGRDSAATSGGGKTGGAPEPRSKKADSSAGEGKADARPASKPDKPPDR